MLTEQTLRWSIQMFWINRGFIRPQVLLKENWHFWITVHFHLLKLVLKGWDRAQHGRTWPTFSRVSTSIFSSDAGRFVATKQSSLFNQCASLPGNQSEGTGREARAGFRHSPSPEFTICHVKLQTCQSQDFLQFYFQGQMLRRGGDPTAGERCPNSCHTSHKDLRGGRAHHCLPFL